eukprot:TRINITY_DN6210_c0_g1_i4.p1 TRINITY_DN6210_c0_g1~~TRINITY_DN6210_c0_g1_i4.p1  ORF type:complete len:240 (+),score=43.35 TRINITY_DN6210_c0_g1_i4:170-889(+)
MEDKAEKDLFEPHTVSKNPNEDAEDSTFFAHKRHIFILTFAGKPVYSRYGDEVKLSSYFASLAALVQKFSVYYSAVKTPTYLRYVQNENTLTVFLFRQKLCYVCLTKDLTDTVPFLTNMLESLNLQIISIVTNSVNVYLETKPNFDPRNFLGGTTSALGMCVKNALSSPCFFLHSYMTLPMNVDYRSKITSLLKENKPQDSLYTILMSPVNIISMVKSCLLYTSPSPRDGLLSRMPSSA